MTKIKFTPAGHGKGKSADFIPGWKAIREAIIERDGYRCRICGKDPVEATLHVHHIDYQRKNNSDNNLVTLCMTCHTQVHREQYKPFEHPEHPVPWGEL